MQRIKDTIAIAIAPKPLRTIAIDYRKEITSKQADAIIEQAVDLIGDVKFKPYFFKTLYMIGPSAFYEAMDWARKTTAKCPQCMFAKRLKELRLPFEQGEIS